MNIDDYTQEHVKGMRATDFARLVKIQYECGAAGGPAEAAHTFAARYPRSPNIDVVMKAVVAAGSTTDATFAAPLAALKPLTDAFLEFVRPLTLLGRIPGLRKVPFNVSVTTQTGGGTYGWVGQGKPKPLTNVALAAVTLGIAKCSGIIVVTSELMKVSSPSADVLLRDELAAGLAQFLDGQLVDPAIAAVANVSPASITNGVTPISSAGTSAANALTDVKALITAFVAANPTVEAMALLLTPATAAALAIATNSQTLTIHGGTIFGVPVVTSASVGARIIAVDARAILVADDGDVRIDASQSAALQMESSPTDPVDASTVMVSMWQQDLVALRVERFANWKRGRLSAVQFVSGVAYA